MKKNGILNSEISKVLSDLGHTDRICIADCGLPIPDGVKKIDLALKFGLPSFLDVFKEVDLDMVYESVILAEEIKENNPNLNRKIKDIICNTSVDYVSHEDFKGLTKDCKVVIRTGENTPYANIILQAGVYFGLEE
jgi:D-ribose pyranase